MLLVIGLKNCSKCTITKQILDSKNIEYEYYTLTELPAEDKRKYAQMARDIDYNDMPLIIKDDKLITL
jgi:glutaredoxin